MIRELKISVVDFVSGGWGFDPNPNLGPKGMPGSGVTARPIPNPKSVASGWETIESDLLNSMFLGKDERMLKMLLNACMTGDKSFSVEITPIAGKGEVNLEFIKKALANANVKVSGGSTGIKFSCG